MKLALVDYGSGNLHSVARAFRAVAGARASLFLAGSAADLEAADRIILPGVCAFKTAMEGLGQRGLLEALEKAVRQDAKPFLGICVGLQIMAERGEEKGSHEGLGWIEGETAPLAPASEDFRIPHMGWNKVRVAREHPLWRGLSDPVLYFAHSYALRPRLRGRVLGESDHGGMFAAAVGRDNMAGAQFHPEKSQKAGLSFLANFLAWNP